jgi:hypothetical protein
VPRSIEPVKDLGQRRAAEDQALLFSRAQVFLGLDLVFIQMHANRRGAGDQIGRLHGKVGSLNLRRHSTEVQRTPMLGLQMRGEPKVSLHHAMLGKLVLAGRLDCRSELQYVVAPPKRETAVADAVRFCVLGEATE